MESDHCTRNSYGFSTALKCNFQSLWHLKAALSAAKTCQNSILCTVPKSSSLSHQQSLGCDVEDVCQVYCIITKWMNETVAASLQI